MVSVKYVYLIFFAVLIGENAEIESHQVLGTLIEVSNFCHI